MTREELLEHLKMLQDQEDTEMAHADADAALLAYINDPAITARYNRLAVWYA